MRLHRGKKEVVVIKYNVADDNARLKYTEQNHAENELSKKRRRTRRMNPECRKGQAMWWRRRVCRWKAAVQVYERVLLLLGLLHR